MPTQPEVQRLRSFLEAAELTPEERAGLDTLLAQVEEGDEVALTRIRQLAFERGDYQPIPGEDFPLPPGPLMVCPKDPAHYRTFQREVGETPRCPVHDVPLVQDK
jgi:hypothetical protein